MGLRISGLTIYPVKSFRGIAVDEAEVVTTGFRHDRQWMLIDDWGSFLSQRQHPAVAKIEATPGEGFLRLAVPGNEPVEIPVTEEGPRIEAQVWGHRCVVIDQGPRVARLLSEYLRRSCRLVRMASGFERAISASYRRPEDGPVGFADAMPFLLTSEASLADLNSRLDKTVTMDRFRSNIVVEGGSPFQEETWKRIRVGRIDFRIPKKCLRCEVINVDQASGVKNIEPMETLESYRSGPKGVAFGVNLIHAGAGRIHVGDELEVLE